MVKKTDNKMTFSFNNYDLMRSLLEDLADVSGQSMSAVVEGIVVNKTMPDNDKAAQLVERYMYGVDGGVNKVLTALFEINSAGVNWQAKYDNYLPLVQYAADMELIFDTTITGNEIEYKYICDQVRCMVNRLSELAKSSSDMFKRTYYKQEVAWGSYVLDELTTGPENSHIINYYQLALHSWDDYKSWTITYRLLASLARIGKWRDTPSARLDLIKIIKDVSASW